MATFGTGEFFASTNGGAEAATNRRPKSLLLAMKET